jgi:hypothetical protein
MPTTGPADTLGYFVAGYVVFFVVTAIYLASLALRRRSLSQDLETLEDIASKEKSKPEANVIASKVEAPEAARQGGESRV